MIGQEQGLSIRTFSDLESLIGTYETTRMEFKGSASLHAKPENEYKADLSKEISGLANTEGGYLVIGIQTERKKGQPDKATSLDGGLPFKEYPPDRLQRRLDGWITPPLHGLRWLVIDSPDDPEKYYAVIAIPRSHTAHQALDKLYYGRSEVETKALDDIWIRTLMNRAAHPIAIVSIARETAEWNGENCKVSFDLELKNDGEVDIREVKVLLRIGNVPEQLGLTETADIDGWRSAAGQSYRLPFVSRSSAGTRGQPSRTSGGTSGCLFPKDAWVIGSFSFTAHWSEPNLSTMQYRLKSRNLFLQSFPGETQAALARALQATDTPVNNDFELEWTVYLSNTHPFNGSIDLLRCVPRTHDAPVICKDG
jgi:hypothetical protein